MRLALRSSRSWVVETGECFLYVVWHGDVDLLVFVVPINRQADVAAAFPLMADGAVLFDGLHEMLGASGAHVLDAEVVHNQAETDWPPIMFPKTQADLALSVSVCI